MHYSMMINLLCKFKLKKGDIFSFNNRRVLHGRTAFNPNSGDRHLQGYYMDRDEIIGRLNFLKKKKILIQFFFRYSYF